MRPARCHPDRPHYARGLCRSDYDVAQQSGMLDEHERTTRPAAELLPEARRLREQCDPPMTWREIADRLGVGVRALEKARERARQGDR